MGGVRSDAGDGPLRFLVCTHHLSAWGGSELVALELIEELRRRSYHVAIYCPFADRERVDPEDPSLLTDHSTIRPEAFDVVYSHHQMPSRFLIDWALRPGPDPWPIFVYNHLSSYEPMEFPGPFCERDVADIVLANSEETRQHLAAYGAPMAGATVFANPAPAAFECPPRPDGDGRPHSILSVSNHRPPELEGALALLEAMGIAVTRIGAGHDYRRLRPSDIEAHDCVVTIGKTVQYALRGRRPLFCYDRFGGPGWLAATNVARAGAANFSGRDCPGPDGSATREAEALAREIIDGFAAARSWSAGFDDTFLAPFRLEDALDELLARIERAARHRTVPAAVERWSQRWFEERALFELVDREYVARTAAQRQFAHARRTIAALKEEGAGSAGSGTPSVRRPST